MINFTLIVKEQFAPIENVTYQSARLYHADKLVHAFCIHEAFGDDSLKKAITHIRTYVVQDTANEICIAVYVKIDKAGKRNVKKWGVA